MTRHAFFGESISNQIDFISSIHILALSKYEKSKGQKVTMSHINDFCKISKEDHLTLAVKFQAFHIFLLKYIQA